MIFIRKVMALYWWYNQGLDIFNQLRIGTCRTQDVKEEFEALNNLNNCQV